jgi:hypothetical protein
MAVQSRHMGEDELAASDVVFSLAISGDETMDSEAWFRRLVWTEDPKDLGSEMHYRIEAIDAPAEDKGGEEISEDELQTLMEQISAEFAKRPGERFTQARACGLVNKKHKKVRAALWRLHDEGYLGDDGAGNAHRYFFVKLYKRPKMSADWEGRSGHGGDDDEEVRIRT